MSMFGWGAGDIIATSQLAVKVYTAYKDSPDDYKHISDEVESLKILIDKAVRHLERTTLDNNSRQEGRQASKGCRDVLVDLNSLIKKYNSSGSSQILKRIKLGTEDIASLTVRLISKTTLLNGFIQRLAIPTTTIHIVCHVKLISLYLSCESREIREMQERMAGVLGLQCTTSRSSITSFAGSINTKMTYKRFCRSLFQAGVTSEMIAQKEEEIINIFNQTQDTATGDERNNSSNITNQSQLLPVSYFLHS